jgi:hypothetical protein
MGSGTAVVALERLEQEIVVALGVERRVEVDEVNAFGREVLAQDLKIVDEIELIHVAGKFCPRRGGGGNEEFGTIAPCPRMARARREGLR